MIERVCKQCGKTYETYPSIRLLYCSRECTGKSKRQGEFIECEQCGKRFWRHPSRSHARFCSKSCARTALNLTEMNPSFTRDVSGEKNPMYGKGMNGEANPMHGKRKELSPRWNGGIKTGHSAGYIRVVAPDDHPYPSETYASGTKYILEHRMVMEKHLGRYLKPEEVVHHMDEDPTNNDISNLALCASLSDHMRRFHSS